MKLIALIWFALFAAPAFSATVNVGGKMVSIPAPEGFDELVPMMGATHAFYSFQPTPDNVLLRVFIDHQTADTAIKNSDSLILASRKISVSVNQAAIDHDATVSDLDGIKHRVVELHETKRAAVLERGKANLGRMLDFAQGFADVKLGLSLEQYIPLPIHDESKEYFSVSVYVRTRRVPQEPGKGEALMSSTCTTFLVQERVLVACMAGEMEEQALQRDTLRAWISNVIRANKRDDGYHRSFPSDDVRIAKLLGIWCSLAPDGKSCVDHHEYREDMTYRSCGIDSLYNKHVFATARVSLVGNTVCLKILESTETTLTPIGYDFCSDVLEIKPTFIRYRLTGRNEVILEKRLSIDSPECPPLPN